MSTNPRSKGIPRCAQSSCATHTTCAGSSCWFEVVPGCKYSVVVLRFCYCTKCVSWRCLRFAGNLIFGWRGLEKNVFIRSD